MAITTLSNYNAKRIMGDPFNEDMLEDRKEIYNEVHGSEIYHIKSQFKSARVGGMEGLSRKAQYQEIISLTEGYPKQEVLFSC